jgi:hypothetical protein
MNRLLLALLLVLAPVAALPQTTALPNTTAFLNTTLIAGGNSAATVTALGQNVTAGFYSTASITTSATVPVGDRIEIPIFGNSSDCNQTSNGVQSVTDASSNTYSVDGTLPVAGTNQSLCFYSAQITTQLNSGSLITLHCTVAGGNCTFSFFAIGLHPSKTSGAIEQTSYGFQSFSTSVSIPAAGAVTSTDLCVAALIGNSNSTEMNNFTGGWTTLNKNTALNSGNWGGLAWIQASSGTPTATMTLNTADNAPSAITCSKEF